MFDDRQTKEQIIEGGMKLHALYVEECAKNQRLEREHDEYMVRANANVCELNREIESLRRDIACRDGGLGSLYSIREALGFNKLYPLSHLDGDARQMRAALLACAPIAHAAIAEEKKNEIGNSDLDNEQPVAVTIRTTLGVIREVRRALFVANIHAPALTKGERS